MYEVEFTLEAVTPIFMRGADQTKAEIRAPSIKGLMRWWFRALAGSYFGDDISGLRKAEEFVFGSTGRRSRIIIEVDSPKLGKFDCKCDINIKFDGKRKVYLLRPKVTLKTKAGGNYPAEIPNYLFFSVNMFIDEIARKTLEKILAGWGIRNQFKSKAQAKGVLSKKGLSMDDISKMFAEKFNKNVLEYYPPNTEFSIQLRSFGEREFKIALLTLWASVVLGGFGFRSRRGAGSLAFAGGDLDVFENLGLSTSFKSPEDLGNSIRRAVKLAGELLNKNTTVRMASYPTLSEKTCCVALWDSGEKDVFGALKKFEGNYLRFRKNVSKPERIIFGLPIKFGGRGVERIKDRLNELKNARRASPMMVGVLKINEKPFLKIVKFRTSKFHYNNKIDEIANWKTLTKFDESIREIVVYGSKSIFEEVLP